MAGVDSAVTCCWDKAEGHTWCMGGVLILATIFSMVFPQPLPAPASGWVVPDGGKAGKPGGGSTEVGTPTPEVLAVVAIAATMVA